MIGDNGQNANMLISKLLEENKTFALSRMGLGEVRWIDWYMRGGLDFNCDGYLYTGNTYTPTLRDRLYHGGIYGETYDYFFEEYIKCISCGDLQVFWFHYNGEKLVYNEQIGIFSKYSNNSIKIDCESLCPYILTNFWTKSLKGKKVLFIYPFVNTIQKQYKNREFIWQGDHSGKLPEFDLITYKPVWVLGENKPHGSFKESLESMKEDISKIDFDVAIVGCSHYGLPLVGYIKNEMNKTAIYMGGELQILFGIKGKRWDQWERVTKHYNEYWTRPTEDIPDNIQMLDDGCYW